MSKTIIPATELSDFDRQYLRDRGLNVEDYLLDAEEEEPITPPIPPQKPQEPPAPAVTETAVTEEETEENTEEDTDEEDVPYTEWTNDELRDELGDRELPQDGKKADLIARLEASDIERALQADA